MSDAAITGTCASSSAAQLDELDELMDQLAKRYESAEHTQIPKEVTNIAEVLTPYDVTWPRSVVRGIRQIVNGKLASANWTFY